MSDTYQPIYDATRSRLSNCDVGEAVRAAVAVEISGLSTVIHSVGQDASIAALEQRTTALLGQLPHVLMRPRVFIDGNQWCALYGDNLQDGVAGFGASPKTAMAAFDESWNSALPAGEGNGT